MRGRHTNSIPCFEASLLKISVSSRGTSGTTSPANKCTMKNLIKSYNKTNNIGTGEKESKHFPYLLGDDWVDISFFFSVNANKFIIKLYFLIFFCFCKMDSSTRFYSEEAHANHFYKKRRTIIHKNLLITQFLANTLHLLRKISEFKSKWKVKSFQ